MKKRIALLLSAIAATAFVTAACASSNALDRGAAGTLTITQSADNSDIKSDMLDRTDTVNDPVDAYSGVLKSVWGSFLTSDGVIKSTARTSLAVNETDGFDRGAVQVTVKQTVPSDAGIVVSASGNGLRYWEGEGIAYYFFFIGWGKNAEHPVAYLGKTDNGKWTALKVIDINSLTFGEPYKLKVVLNGTDLNCYVNDKLYIVFSERRFLRGTGYGIRAGAVATEFSDFSVSKTVV